ncbi:hypothetical protein BJ322DRAFT_1081538 [Thelephora terrestris]|uniref:F-box domain-containing protein n=1 Tax=Thelephora terrestris TaxID=56493 RepID=A0A9P6H8G3_9AGAM|nr:hypothetical protein BJ322DRAFT_1081538 [Thelephora terrestris]
MDTDPSEVHCLERNAFEVLRSARSINNTLAPINRIPPELFPMILQCWDGGCTDRNLITLTHVCQRWREVFTAHSTLWTYLKCKDVEKTRVYIERSKASPLKISLRESREQPHHYTQDAFLLVIPHISRVTSIMIFGGEELFETFTVHFACPVPLLRHLTLHLSLHPLPVLSSTLFNGNLPSLRTLSLGGIIPHLPWQNLPQLTAFTLFGLVSKNDISVTRLLDFFSNAPLLREIDLRVLPKSSDAPPGRVVSLPCLENFKIMTDNTHASTLLNHLSIPAGAILDLAFDFHGSDSPLPDFLPKNPDNLQNLLHITSAHLCAGPVTIGIKLGGPSGGLDMYGNRKDWRGSDTMVSERRTLPSLDYFDISRIQRLAVTAYSFPWHNETDESIQHVLNIMSDLRALFLNQCTSEPFISALDPEQNHQKLVLCPKLERLVFCVDVKECFLFYIGGLADMVKGRASKGSKLRSIIVITLGGLMFEREVSKLREYVEHVEHRFEKRLPEWDGVF